MLVIDENVVYFLRLELAAGIDHENRQVEFAPVAKNVMQSLLGDLD